MEYLRTIVALGLLTQPRKERLAVRHSVQWPILLAGEGMSTSHAVNMSFRLAVVKDGVYDGGGLV